MREVEKLKPCPFCGSKDIYFTETAGRIDITTTIFCNTCKTSVILEENEEEGFSEKTTAKATEAWNRRVDNGN